MKSATSEVIRVFLSFFLFPVHLGLAGYPMVSGLQILHLRDRCLLPSLNERALITEPTDMENCQQITVSLNLLAWDGSIDQQQPADYIMVENFNRVYRKQGHHGNYFGRVRGSGYFWKKYLLLHSALL